MIFTQHSPRSKKPVPAVFLDRDGTINIEKNHLYKSSDWEWVPGAQEAIRLLNSAGYKVVVVSNQAGIARGMYAAEDVNALHVFVNGELGKTGAHIDAFCFCPHHPEFSGECECRKPSPAMLLHAAEKLNIDLRKSWMVGDKLIDVQAGQKAGTRALLVRTGYGGEEEKRAKAPVHAVDDLLAAVKHIVAP